MVGKKIGHGDIIGEQGIALIHSIVSGMGWLWHQAGGVEAGIDGEIEIRDPVTMLVSGCIIRVQSKATTVAFPAETDDSFEWDFNSRDLEYWLAGNVPVILVVSRPAAREAYWVSINDYFREPEARAARRIRFEKKRDRFDDSARAMLAGLAVPANTDLNFASVPKPERLYSNLLSVKSYPPYFKRAETSYTTLRDLWREVRVLDRNAEAPCILRSRSLISFADLREFPWCEVCDSGSVESFDTDELAHSDDPTERRLFVELLNRTLRDQLREIGVHYDKAKDYFFFSLSRGQRNRFAAYKSKQRRSRREVVKAYLSNQDGGRVKYYRHAAFRGFFTLVDGQWYFEITPTYRFTWNGRDLHSAHAELLKGIKRVEGNAAVLGQVVMWACLLAERPQLFATGEPRIDFGSLMTFDVEKGIDDGAWGQRDDEAAEDGTDSLQLSFDLAEMEVR